MKQRVQKVMLYAPTSRGFQRCLLCGSRITTARGSRAAHERTRRHKEVLNEMMADMVGTLFGVWMGMELRKILRKPK